MENKMKRILLFIILMLTTSSCYRMQINTAPTPVGYKAYVEAIKRNNQIQRRADKYHRQERRRIKKLQNLKLNKYDN